MKIIFVYSEITENTVEEIRFALSETKEIDINVNSSGGSVIAGMKIYKMICDMQKDRNSIISISFNGVAAGVASFCFLCGGDIFMDKDAYFILTKPFVVCTKSDPGVIRADLEKLNSDIVEIYERHLTIGRGKILELMESEQPIDFAMAMRYGLVHQEL